MAFVSVEDATNPSSPITGVFSARQTDPVPPGYIGPIPDDDPRIAAFYEALTAAATPTLESLQAQLTALAAQIAKMEA